MKKTVSTIILLTAAVLWGLSSVAQKSTTVVPTFTLLFLRSIVAVIALVPTVIIIDKISKNGRRLLSFNKDKPGITKREILGGTVCGVFMFAASALQQAGIAHTDAGKTAFITALYVVIVPIYAIFLKKRPSLNAWVGIAVSVVGFYLLCVSGGFTIAGSDMLVFASAFAFALQIVAVDFFLPKCDAVRISLVQFSAMSLFSLAWALIAETPVVFSTILSVLPQILFIGIGSSAIAFTLQMVGQKNCDPTIAAIILSLESVFGAVFAAMILSERMSVREYIGCAVVLLAVLISKTDFKTIISGIRDRKNVGRQE